MTIAAPPRAPSAGLVVLPEMSADDKKRLQDIANRRKAFSGDFDKPFKKVKPEDPDFSILDNRCAPVVLKGMSFLFGKPLSISIKLAKTDAAENTVDNAADDSDAPDSSPEQLYLDAALGDLDDFMTLLSEDAINGGVCGHAFIKLLEKDAQHPYPRLVVLDPSTVWVETRPDDCRAVVAFNLQYKTKDAQGHDIYQRQRIWQEDPASWTVQNYTQTIDATGIGTVGGRWVPQGEPIDWPYPFPPIAHNPNMPNPNEFWGMPDLTDDFINLNNKLNLIESNIAKLLYFYGHPYIFIDSGTGSLPITPGMATGIPQGAHVTAVQATGDIANARAFASDLRDTMDEISRVPAVALGRLESLPRGNISGVALKLLFQPLIEKTELKRRLYGRMIRDVCQRILALNGMGNGESLPVELHWPELLPDDELQSLQALALKKQMGIWSDQTLVEEAGGDYKEEVLRKLQEAKEAKANQPTPPSAPPTPTIPAPGQPPPAPMPPAMQTQQAKLTGG